MRNLPLILMRMSMSKELARDSSVEHPPHIHTHQLHKQRTTTLSTAEKDAWLIAAIAADSIGSVLWHRKGCGPREVVGS